MINRLFSSASFCFFLILAGCNTNVATSEDLGNYGVCEYSNRVKNGEKIAVVFRCYAESRTDEKGKKYKPTASLHCSDDGKWSIILNAGYYESPTAIVLLEYQFDDDPAFEEKWGRFLLWPYAYQDGKEPNREFIYGMKTARKLTYSLDERTVTIDLTGVGVGAALFEENCNGLTNSKT